MTPAEFEAMKEACAMVCEKTADLFPWSSGIIFSECALSIRALQPSDVPGDTNSAPNSSSVVDEGVRVPRKQLQRIQTILETFAQYGMANLYYDGSETPNAVLAKNAAADLVRGLAVQTASYPAILL